MINTWGSCCWGFSGLDEVLSPILDILAFGWQLIVLIHLTIYFLRPKKRQYTSWLFFFTKINKWKKNVTTFLNIIVLYLPAGIQNAGQPVNSHLDLSVTFPIPASLFPFQYLVWNINQQIRHSHQNFKTYDHSSFIEQSLQSESKIFLSYRTMSKNGNYNTRKAFWNLGNGDVEKTLIISFNTNNIIYTAKF